MSDALNIDTDFTDDEDDLPFASDTSTTTTLAVPPGMKAINPFVLFRQRNSSSGFFRGDVVKMGHTDGVFYRERGKNKSPLKPDEAWITNPLEMVDVWSKFVDGKLVDRKVYRTVDGEMSPKRAELGDNDETLWPWAGAGKPRKDPWSRAVYLPMKNAVGDIVVVFKATGGGAIGEIAELCGMFGQGDRGGKLPVVVLENRSFEPQHGGTIFVPVFRLVGWEFWDGQPTAAVKPVLIPIAPPAAPAQTAQSSQPTKPALLVNPATQQAVTKVPPPDLDDSIPF
jgi:hypothetical protein